MSRTARIGLVIAVVAVAVVAFLVLRPDDESDKTTTAPGASTTATMPTGGQDHAMEPEVVRVTVKGGGPVNGVVKATAIKGQTVRLIVKSDAAAELHVHGYNLSKTVPAGGRSVISFPATIDGVFEIELHLHEGKPAQIASLKVQP